MLRRSCLSPFRFYPGIGVHTCRRLSFCVSQLSNIAFIKTHKTASTTLASILYRYGMRHDSNIANFEQGSTFIDLEAASKLVRVVVVLIVVVVDGGGCRVVVVVEEVVVVVVVSLAMPVSFLILSEYFTPRQDTSVAPELQPCVIH